MKEFLDFLSRGKFRIPICNNCHTKIWPPSNICNNCYSKRIRMSKLDRKCRLIEHSKSFIGENKNLGLVEMSGIRIIGVLSEEGLKTGCTVKLMKCGVDKDNLPYYEFSSA
jgi:uncharacterized OB-fold protein